MIYAAWAKVSACSKINSMCPAAIITVSQDFCIVLSDYENNSILKCDQTITNPSVKYKPLFRAFTTRSPELHHSIYLNSEYTLKIIWIFFPCPSVDHTRQIFMLPKGGFGLVCGNPRLRLGEVGSGDNLWCGCRPVKGYLRRPPRQAAAWG